MSDDDMFMSEEEHAEALKKFEEYMSIDNVRKFLNLPPDEKSDSYIKGIILDAEHTASHFERGSNTHEVLFKRRLLDVKEELNHISG